MKLYEFTMVDNMSLNDEEINNEVIPILEEEAELKGWAPGYTWIKIKSQKILQDIEYPLMQYGNSCITHFIEVYGELNKKRWPDE